jgi:hypothetical protein
MHMGLEVSKRRKGVGGWIPVDGSVELLSMKD